MTPFLRRALEESVSLAGDENQNRCFRAQALSRRLWPDSPAWQRHSNNGPNGSTVGQGIKRAAGKPLAQLRGLGYVRYCTRDHFLDGSSCGGYVVTPKGREAATERTTRATGTTEPGREEHA